MARWLDRLLSPFRVIGTTTGSRVCLCLLISYLAALAAFATIGRQGVELFGRPQWLTLSPLFPPFAIFVSVLFGLSGAPTFGLFVYPVVLTFYALFVCRKLPWGWLGVPFALMWLDLYRLVIVVGDIVGC
jgi:hypothetical protein